MRNPPAYRLNGARVSREDFYRNACDPTRSAVVEACAGAGKTWMLVSRILRALLDGAAPHEILAITFTRKAAGEMQQRLFDWLREFADPGTSPAQLMAALIERGVAPEQAGIAVPALAALHEKVLGAVRGVQVQTFHAWFAKLLRAAPIELLDEIGLQRDMELIEALDDHSAEVWRRFHAAVATDPAMLKDFEALSAQRGRSTLRLWLRTALERRVEIELADRAGVLEDSVPEPAQVWQELKPGEHPALALEAPAWQSRLRDLATELGRGAVQARGAADGLASALENCAGSDLFNAVWAALFTLSGTPRKRLGNSTLLTEVHDLLERSVAQIRQYEAREEHLMMVRLSRVLNREYAAYKRAQGLADMSDLESCALALLRDSSLSGWVQERLDARYRHVLIDEFQDTSPLQWHALHAWLSAYVGAGGGASGQRPPSVFIVGDPKQSIYRFRRAEPRVFKAARNFVQTALDGAVLECDHTRRNAPQILGALNAVFGAAAAAAEFGDFRSHSTEVDDVEGAGLWALPLVERAREDPSRSDGRADQVWRDSLTSPRRLPEEVRRAQEARNVALAVHELLANASACAGDVMVLCRKRQSLRLAAQALRELGIPHVAVEDHDLLDAVEVRDLVALLDVLASHGHSLSLAQALRSPLFGASDQDLIVLASCAALGGDWWDALMNQEHDSAVLQRARTLLQQWDGDARQLPPHDLLDRIIHQGQYRERVAAVVSADQRAVALEAVDALLEQSLTLDAARYATPYNFVRAVKRRTIRVASREHADSVRLLTIHGAKGLEARVVFVMDADPQPTPARTANVLVDWPVESEAPTRCAFLYSEARCPESLNAQLQFEIAARQREELNGLYVAMTRAKEHLLFSATEPSRHAGGPSWWARLADYGQAWPLMADPALGHGRASEAILLKGLPVVPPSALVTAPQPTADSGESDLPTRRLGRAVHRFLEWAGGAPIPCPKQTWPTLASQAALEFNASVDDVLTIGRRILESADCAGFFSGNALRWVGNEVPVCHAGEVLRIDRLVQLDQDGAIVWWVLDYKLAREPNELHSYREQLLRYRDAISGLEAGAAVRCGFITSQGQLVELH